MPKEESPRMIEIGASCNNNCVFCCQSEMRNHPDKTTAEIISEIDLAKNDQKNKVSFLGGEFTIRPDCFTIIGHAKKLGFEYIHITTNGRMFSYDDFAKSLIGAGLTVANFSVYGPDTSVHDACTRVKGSFDECIKGLKNFMKYERRVAASVTVTKQNHQYVLATVKSLQALGVHLFHINCPIPEGLAKDNFHEVIPSYAEIVPQISEALDYCKRENLFVRITNMPICLMHSYQDYIDEVCNEPISVKNNEGLIITEDEKRKSMKMKLASCSSCKYYKLCEGVFREYVKHFGEDEFRPC